MASASSGTNCDLPVTKSRCKTTHKHTTMSNNNNHDNTQTLTCIINHYYHHYFAYVCNDNARVECSLLAKCIDIFSLGSCLGSRSLKKCRAVCMLVAFLLLPAVVVCCCCRFNYCRYTHTRTLISAELIPRATILHEHQFALCTMSRCLVSGVWCLMPIQQQQ